MSLLPATVGRAIPALIDAGTAARIGPRTSDIPIRTGGIDMLARVVGVVDYFPTFYPGDEFMIVPIDLLLDEAGFLKFATLNPNETWISMNSSAIHAATALLRRSANVQSVDDRVSLTGAALHDPVLMQLQSNLAIGFVAALALALVGFAVHSVSTIRRRSADLAVLHANGVPRRVTGRSILWEQAAVGAFSLLLGCGLGLSLAFMLLPSLEFGSRAQDLAPPTIVTFDGTALMAGGLLVVIAITALTLVIVRVAARSSPLDEIRKLG